MKLGIIGLGDIAQKAYLPILAQLPNVELILCSRNSNTLEQLSKQYRIDTHTTRYEDLPKLGVDAVMIHAATSVHAEIAQHFLKLNIPTFVDKPLATTGSVCEELFNLAESQNTPLYMGFNRRHLPLVSPHLQPDKLRSLRWEKHRHNLPGDIRTFIFDDFIHPLDSINIAAKSNLDDVTLLTQNCPTTKKLARIDLIFEKDKTQFHASMNRLNGQTHEVITIDEINRRVLFENFVEGREFIENQTNRVQLPDWTPMLTSKGFDTMIKDWLEVVKTKKMNPCIVQRNVATHWLAEHVCSEIERRTF